MSKQTTSTTITALKHADKRVNIPTEELRDFVVNDEQAPKSLRYPRDPSLDPQLVWRGKDEQDAQDLAVPSVPIYIQEKIHPQSIINDLLAHAAKPGSTLREAAASYQLNLFADFNGGPEEFDQKVEFYQHEQNWANRLILGDSLLVMASLAEKEGLRGKVQMIYLDPPYGIKFGSNWQVSTRKRDVKDGKAEDATRQPEQVRAFRDTWKLGIHSYLAYLRDRLVVARELLTETGSVFVQIGDENVHLVRCVLDEVFGSESFVSLISFTTTTSQTSQFVPCVVDYILWYAKERISAKFRELRVPKSLTSAADSAYAKWEVGGNVFDSKPADGDFSLLVFDNLTSRSGSESTRQPFEFAGKKYFPGAGGWKTNETGLRQLARAGRLYAKGNSLFYKRYFSDFPFTALTNTWSDTQQGGFGKDSKIYVVQTSAKAIERCLLMTTDPGDLVLDPTCGSGTTAYVAEQWGRRWITCDTSRVALALARTRLMAAKYPYYLLADSPEGIEKEAELGRTLAAQSSGLWYAGAVSQSAGLRDIRKGFVYKRVPHVTLKSIANNPDTHAGMTRAEIDAAIARHTDNETLYDQPYEDNKRVRVCGPFSVESLSPHRVLSTADEFADGALSEQEARQQQDFATMILDNLKKAGVQNTRKGERLTFDRLEPYAGVWLHAAGEYTETVKTVGQSAGLSEYTRRVAISIGPEHGTVGPEQIKEAAKEAVQGVGFDLLVVCGFAFDPHVSEEVKRYGKLTVLPAKMNPDLAMGDELLKKTGAGNLFMVFGEPDVEIRKVRSDDFSRSEATKVATTNQIVVEIKGVDVYDPTTGQIRSASTDDIACWFIDTDYNGESFFVRHAYFTGAEEPYDKLKRALRAEIDEAAWSVLYSTVSRPFAPPKAGKIAIKVINHYGDEVLKVFGV